MSPSKKKWLSHNCQYDVTFRLDEIQNGAQWVKCKRLINMRNFASKFCPGCLGSLICDVVYVTLRNLYLVLSVSQNIQQVDNLVERFLF